MYFDHEENRRPMRWFNFLCFGEVGEVFLGKWFEQQMHMANSLAFTLYVHGQRLYFILLVDCDRQIGGRTSGQTSLDTKYYPAERMRYMIFPLLFGVRGIALFVLNWQSDTNGAFWDFILSLHGLSNLCAARC